MYFVYALFNKEHSKIYIGQTENLEERLRLHREKKFSTSFTSSYNGEWILIYKEKAVDRKSALLRERQLKSYRGREFIRKFIP